MSNPAETTDAFVFRSINRGESDRLLTLFTRERGKVGGLARGARKSRRRFGGAFEPFALIEITLKPARGNLYQIAGASVKDAHMALAENLQRTQAAASIFEIAREVVLENQPDRKMFKLIEETLAALCRSPEIAIGSISTAATLRLLGLAGIDVAAAHCSSCGHPVPENRRVKFHPARGGVVCTPCGGGPITLSREAAAALRSLGCCLPENAALHPQEKPVLEELLSALIDFIEYHIERRLKVRLFQQK